MKDFAIIMLLAGLSSCAGRRPEKTGLEGKALPSFKILLSDSTTYFNTKSISIGKPIVFFYFGPHCPYSRLQMEEIIKHMTSLKDISFYVFTQWSFDEMKSFYQHYQLNKYPNIKAGVDYTNFFADYFQVQGVPYTAIYGRDIKLHKAFVGSIDSWQIKEVAEN
jgi:hypothetical protein